MIRVKAYHRRRGWQAWQTAALGRFTWKNYSNGIPPLHQLMGTEPPNERAQTLDEMHHAMAAWVASTRKAAQG